jgi:hypothetical protein
MPQRPSRVNRVDFRMSAVCPVKGLISEMPVVRFQQLKASVRTRFLLPKPGPRIMRSRILSALESEARRERHFAAAP